MELTGPHPEKVAKPPRLVAFIVFVAVFMAVVDGSVVNIALPTITTYFGVNVGLSQWVVTGYLVTMTSLLLIFGRVSEYFGRGRVFTTGFLVFTLGSLACGLAPSLPALVFFRVIQAIGGAMLFSLSSAITTISIRVRNWGRRWAISWPRWRSGASQDPSSGVS